MLTQVHVYIKGDVIGVGFRAWTKIQAKLNNINGWVKNSHTKPEVFGREGGVEAVFQGQESNVDNIILIVEKGSPISRVEEVEIFWQEPKEVFAGFEIRK